MRDDFSILIRFLDSFGDEVRGHAAEPPPPEMREDLRLFAAGALPSERRDALVETLRQHPEWIAYLAEEVKARRTDALE